MKWERISLILTVSVSILSAIITAFFVFKSYHNVGAEYMYKGLPFASQLFTHERDLIKFYEENSGFFGQVDGKDKFNEYLERKLVEYIDHNAFNNDQKSAFLHVSKRFIFASLFILIIAFVPS